MNDKSKSGSNQGGGGNKGSGSGHRSGGGRYSEAPCKSDTTRIMDSHKPPSPPKPKGG